MSVDRLKKAAGYRRKAQEIRAIVEKITIHEAREQLLGTAAHLEELAQEEEREARADGSKSEPQAEA